MNANLNTPIWQLTVGEFIEMVDQYQGQEKNSVVVESCKKNLVYGLDGLAKLLGCSKTTAQLRKNSGVIDSAIIQSGRKLIVDADKALELLKLKP